MGLSMKLMSPHLLNWLLLIGSNNSRISVTSMSISRTGSCSSELWKFPTRNSRASKERWLNCWLLSWWIGLAWKLKPLYLASRPKRNIWGSRKEVYTESPRVRSRSTSTARPWPKTFRNLTSSSSETATSLRSKTFHKFLIPKNSPCL